MFNRITDNALKRRIRQHVIGREHIFFASVQPGFENTITKELSSFGLRVCDKFIEGGVEFEGGLDDCFVACMRSRTASRILMRITTFRAGDFYELERSIRSFPWKLYLNPATPVTLNITSRKSMIYHTGKLEEIFKRELPFSYLSEEKGMPDGESFPGQTLFIRNFRDICTVSIDASGDFLYRRGIRKHTGSAPLRETLAALILLEAGVENYDMLIDPMCGSGTFSIECASIFSSTPPNPERNFPFMLWPSFKERNFIYLKNRVLQMQDINRIAEKGIITSDIDPAAVETAASNVPVILNRFIKPEQRDFFSMDPEIHSGKKILVVLNPPYGKRLVEKDLAAFYRKTGDKLKNEFNNCGYAVIAPGIAAEKALGLKYGRKIPFMNGGIRAAVLFRDI